MSGNRPYDEYEPNEPVQNTGGGNSKKALTPATPFPADERQIWTADAWDQPMPPERSYTQRTWDEEDYQPNEPSEEPADRRRRTAEREKNESTAPGETASPYIQRTWDEEDYGAPSRPAALHFDADADSSPNTAPAKSPAPRSTDDPARPNPYARPASEKARDNAAWSDRFAPPLKFEYRKPGDLPEGSSDSQNFFSSVGEPEESSNTYRVEAEPRKHTRRKRHLLRRWMISLLVLALVASSVYLERDWVFEQLKALFGKEAVESVQQAVAPVAKNDTPVSGYDPAPALQATDRAKKGISAVAGTIGLESYAVTISNVIARIFTGEGLYDYYLFASADGKLLGYYEGLPENGFLVCPDDVYYVATPPYLINDEGRALIDTGRYAQSVGADPVLGPMINGWALLGDASLTEFNYVNADSNALSTLWFSKAYPFTADDTIAYVDTGNVTDPEERYALYELNQDGGMTLWRHTADMSDVLGCACGVAVMSDGELILLDGEQTTLCASDDVAAYVDCGAIVARDPDTGKYGLFVNGEQQYDFAYDSIAPVASDDVQWHQEDNAFYHQYTVTGMAYPLPLSHYFQLKKGDTEEMVALSTTSVYPLLLSIQN